MKIPALNLSGLIKDQMLLWTFAAALGCIGALALTGILLKDQRENHQILHNQQQASQISTLLASEIAFLIKHQIGVIESLAQDPGIIQLFKSRDNIALSARATELGYLFPGLLRMRLLRPGTTQTDESSTPPLGYAALALIRESEEGRLPPAEAHVFQGKYSVALTRPVRDPTTKEIIGHILTQLAVDNFTAPLEPAARGGNYVGLFQVTAKKEIKLFSKGDNSADPVRKDIPGSRWKIFYRFNPPQEQLEDLTPILLGGSALLILLAFFGIKYLFSRSLNHDLGVIISFIREFSSGQKPTSYALHIFAVYGALESIQKILHNLTRAAAAAPPLVPASIASLSARPVSLAAPKFFSEGTSTTPSEMLQISTATPNLSTVAPNIPPGSSIPAPVPAAPLLPPDVIPVPAAVPPAPIPAPAPEINLLDMNLAPPPVAPAPKVTPPPSPAPAAKSAGMALSLMDLDLSDISQSANKSTITLPTSNTTPEPPPSSYSVALQYPPPPIEIFRAYDIRGEVDNALTFSGMELIGRAIGSEARDRGQNQMVIGRDGRISSPEFAPALIRGIISTGCSVIDIGIVPTPVLYFATNFLTTNAGAMVTASHNPAQWNGVKIVLGGETLFGKGIEKLYHRIEEGQFQIGTGDIRNRNINAEYLEKITENVQLIRPLKIVIDCANGAASVIAPQLYRALGCEVHELFCEMDGTFPNHAPDPTQPGNLKYLIEGVQALKADLGLAFDGDGDRIIAISGDGTIIWPDRLLMLFAGDFLAQNPGETIIFDVKSSINLPRVIKKHGGRPLMWKTGHSLIKAKMKETGALIGGEMSGHIILKDRWIGFDDGLYAGARLLEILSRDERSPTAIFNELPEFAQTTPDLRLDLPEGESTRLIKNIASARTRITGAEITHLDGLRADFEEGWGLVRASNTSSALTFRFEANTPQGMRRIQEEFRRILLEIGPGLKLPF